MFPIWPSFITNRSFYQVIFYIAMYAIFCYSLYTIAKKRGETNTILAWIPIANIYLLGLIIGDFTIMKQHMKNVEILLPLAVVLFYVIGGAWYVGYILSGICLLFVIYALYNYYNMVQPERAVFYAIISAILPTIAIPVIFLLIKDK